jgi:feruloyl esterase
MATVRMSRVAVAAALACTAIATLVAACTTRNRLAAQPPVACTALQSEPGVTAAADTGPDWTSPGGAGPGRRVAASFCRVELMLEGRVGVELWLPAPASWNGRFLGVGVGGDAGVFNFADMARATAAGFATASTDSGHKSAERQWMMRRDAVLDYTHRSQHMMNVAARRIMALYYGRSPDYAYFAGCSGGGRQALKEMQRFPDDYDGVIAGAGGPRMPEMSVRHLWHGLYQERNPAGALTDADWNLVAAAAVQACDVNDGVSDGVVENPARCRFDPGPLQCAAGKTSGCLTSEQVATVRAFHAPLRDEQGRALDRGMVPGVRTRPGPPSPLLLPVFQQGAHQDLSWTTARFHMADDLALIRKTMPEMAADDPDIRKFIAAGGRAILYQGWLDPSIIADQSITYWESVRDRLGAGATERALRLYMVPGMLHCRGGAGVDEFGAPSASLPIGSDPKTDLLAALMVWVEQGKAPREIIGTRLERGTPVRTHPLCPYPQQAVHTGGDPARAENFRCERVY